MLSAPEEQPVFSILKQLINQSIKTLLSTETLTRAVLYLWLPEPRSSESRAAPREGEPGAASAQGRDKPMTRHSSVPREVEQRVVAVAPISTPAPKPSMKAKLKQSHLQPRQELKAPQAWRLNGAVDREGKCEAQMKFFGAFKAN